MYIYIIMYDEICYFLFFIFFQVQPEYNNIKINIINIWHI